MTSFIQIPVLFKGLGFLTTHPSSPFTGEKFNMNKKSKISYSDYLVQNPFCPTRKFEEVLHMF